MRVGAVDVDFEKYTRLQPLANTNAVRTFSDKSFSVFEKIDGGNCQVRNINNNLVAGNKANFLRGKIVQKRPWFGELTKWMYSNTSLYNLPQDVILFGEWSGNHTIQYGPEHTDKFFMIDVLNLGDHRYLPYKKAQNFLERLEIKGVRYLDQLYEGVVTPDLLNRLLGEESDYYEGHREGLVLKGYDLDPQVLLKLHHDTFKEFFSHRDSPDHLTPSRYRKGIHQVLDTKGDELMEMRALVDEVYKDIIREGGVPPKKRVIRDRLNQYLESGYLEDVRGYISS